MKVITSLVMVFLIISCIKAQEFEKESSYLSFNLGGYKTNLGHKVNNSYSRSLAIGAGYGHALSLNTFIYSKFTYYTMPKFLAYEPPPGVEEQQADVSQLRQVKASVNQSIFDLGLQYNFHLPKELLFNIIGGLSYTLFNQEVHELDGTIILKIDNMGLFGYFGGINLEKAFKDDAVTAFGELQYNYTMKDAANYRKIFSGMNYTVGLRFYLSRSSY